MSPARPSPLRSPWLWLWAQAVLIFAFLTFTSLSGVLRGFDARTYEQTLAAPAISGKLQSMRTLGYPLFLAAVARLSRGPEAVAIAQLLAFVLGVLAFARGFERFSGSAGLALAAATPLLYGPLLVVYSAAILADVLAAALALVTLGGLFQVLARPASWVGWATLTVFLFLTYQTRPSYLFLLVLVPLAGGLVAWRRFGWGATSARLLAGLLVATLLPFLGWSALRGFTTGHFGLVSFGGVNLVGLTASMLSPEVVRQLPAEHQALGRKILEQRAARQLKTSGELRFKRWNREYNKNVWRMAAPAALRLCRRPGQDDAAAWVEANRCLTGLSWAVIRLRPGLYARWVATAFAQSLAEIGREALVRGGFLLLLLVLAIRALVIRPLWRRGPARSVAAPATFWPVGGAGVDLALVAGLFLAGSLGLMVLVESPIDRYLYAAMLLLPSALAALAVELLLAPRAQATELSCD